MRFLLGCFPPKYKKNLKYHPNLWDSTLPSDATIWTQASAGYVQRAIKSEILEHQLEEAFKECLFPFSRLLQQCLLLMISLPVECVVGVSFKANADVLSMGRKQPESEWVLTCNQLIGFSSSSLSAGYQFFDAEPRRNLWPISEQQGSLIPHWMSHWNWFAVIAADYAIALWKIFKRASASPSSAAAVGSSHVSRRSGGAFQKKKRECIRSHVWCLPLCLRGRVGEDNTVLHAQTTVVSCQQSSQSSLKTNFLLVSWEEVWGFGGHYRAVKQNQALYHGFYLQCSAACCQFLYSD